MTRKQEVYVIFFAFMMFFAVVVAALFSVVRDNKKLADECQKLGGAYIYGHCLDVKEIK